VLIEIVEAFIIKHLFNYCEERRALQEGLVIPEIRSRPTWKK